MVFTVKHFRRTFRTTGGEWIKNSHVLFLRWRQKHFGLMVHLIFENAATGCERPLYFCYVGKQNIERHKVKKYFNQQAFWELFNKAQVVLVLESLKRHKGRILMTRYGGGK